MQMHIGINNIFDRDKVVSVFPGLKKTGFAADDDDHRST